MPASRGTCSRGQTPRRRWRRVLLTAALALGGVAAGDWVPGVVGAQEADVGLTSPTTDRPDLLDEADVLRGLRLRLNALEERNALRQMQRSQEPARSYDLPEAASEAPAPPDMPGGEVDAERGAE